MKEVKKINAYKLSNLIFGILILGLIGFDAYLFDITNGNLFFVIHAISVFLSYLLTIFAAKVYDYFDESKDEFGDILVCNILNLVPGVNFFVLLFLIIVCVQLIIRYFESSGKFTFKP